MHDINAADRNVVVSIAFEFQLCWSCLQGVCSLMWGEDAKTLFVGAADHNLRIYGVPS